MQQKPFPLPEFVPQALTLDKCSVIKYYPALNWVGQTMELETINNEKLAVFHAPHAGFKQARDNAQMFLDAPDMLHMLRDCHHLLTSIDAKRFNADNLRDCIGGLLEKYDVRVIQ